VGLLQYKIEEISGAKEWIDGNKAWTFFHLGKN
jgi:hypothetical protein